jgi:fucose 4-O-acetylase-like acetyltransferase
MDKIRLPYIDQLKGLAIILVVIGHVSLWCGDSKGVIFNFIYLFHMPLFFILSGLVVKELSNQTATNKIAYLIKKFNIVLIPFLAWSVILVLFEGISYMDFLSDIMKKGYWYLWIIFQFYFFYILFDSLSYWVNAKKKIIIDLIILFVAYFALKIGYHFISEQVNCFIGYLYWISYLPYFMAGVIISKYNLSDKLFTSHVLYAFALVILFVISVFNVEFYDINFIIAFSIITILFGFFYQLSSNCITNSLSYIGKYTLSIYVMHYFLLPYVHVESFIKTLEDSNNIIAEAALLIVISVAVCYICIFVDHLMQQNKYLARIFLGKLNS